jgi:hypothetical protein
MLIPLGHGGLSSIDTSAISDSRVIEELRNEDDMGIPQRQGMVDLMEREAEQADQRAQIEREVIREQERQITEERQQIEQERQVTQQEQQQGGITQQEADRREQEAVQREQELARREDELEQRRDEAQRLEDFAEQRIEEAQAGREEIARDQQSLIIQETTGGILGITIERTYPPMGRLIRFNPVTGEEIRRSPLNTVYSRTVTFIGQRIIAIAGENVGQGAVRLVEITQDTLTIARQGDDNIRPGSLLWLNGSDLYAIIAEGNNSFLGRFDSNLVLQARSAVRVHNDAAVSVQQGRLLTQDENGSPLILNPVDLTEIR